MVKYGKLYRELQIKEFQGNYIDYKKLKQKIKQMQKVLPRTSQELINKRNSNTTSIKINLRQSLSELQDDSRIASTASSLEDKYSVLYLEFKELLDQEFQRCYKFFKKIRKQLYGKVNKHLYTQTHYSSYKIVDIINELGNLRLTIYLAKSLNAFINDNMMAIKKILKKFDKKFYNYFGNFAPKYIFDLLCMQNSELEYLLQFKIIDEASCIIESNTKLLRDCFLEIIDSNKNSNVDKNNFYHKYNDILSYIKDIDELIYFKIQYKEWFYFRKKDVVVSTESKLYKNIMFNPILFSAFHKDDLMNKFLSRKEEIKEVEEVQIPLSTQNKINIILIFIHTFFYNTLITGIYPLLFLYIKDEKNETIVNDENEEYRLSKYNYLIIASTYICSYLSILFYHYIGLIRIKCAYISSYILFFISCLFHILSYKIEKETIQNGNEGESYLQDFLEKGQVIGLLVASRVLLGLGANPTMGKNYILSYASKYFLPLISKYYVIISIIGYSFGPLIGFLLYYDDKEQGPLFEIIHYSYRNCVAWYGLIVSGVLLIINIFLFTSPSSDGFHKLNKKTTTSKNIRLSSRETPFLTGDFEDSQDKEFYKLQKEMKSTISLEVNGKEEEFKEFNDEPKFGSLSKKRTKNSLITNDEFDNIDYNVRKTNTSEEFNTDKIPNYKNRDIHSLMSNNNEEDEFIENDKTNGSFVNVNMIPRTIDDLIRKEKNKFSYLNRNLLTILIILFFNNLLKENFIAYCSYYSIDIDKESDTFKGKYLCLLISGSYFVEIFSIFFIFPFYKINTIFKKLIVILMCSTIIFLLLIVLFFFKKIYLQYYFIIISFIILLTSIIEVLSSCYLAYLTPPEWKIFNFNAGALPLYISTFGKLSGCLICLISSIGDLWYLNYIIVIILTFIGYGISGFYIVKSKNFRIKSIARIIRKSELESNIY